MSVGNKTRRSAGACIALAAVACLGWAGARAAHAAPAEVRFYVAPGGNDAWSGKRDTPNAGRTDGPFATPARARDAVRALRAGAGLPGPVTIVLRGGVYELPETLTFGPEDSGTAECPVTYRGYPREQVVLRGARRIAGPWQPHQGGIWKTVVPEAKAGRWYFRQLFVDGRRQIRSRAPNVGFYYADPLDKVRFSHNANTTGAEKQRFAYRAQDIRPFRNLNDAEVIVFHSWSESRLRIASVDEAMKQVAFTGPASYPFSNWDSPRYYVENTLEALDAPGEWYLDRQDGTLYFWPPAQVDLRDAEITAPYLQQLVAVRGDAAAGKFVRHLHFRDLTFTGTDYVLPEAGYPNPGAALGPRFRPSALLFEAAEDCSLRHCRITNVATYAVEMAGQCKRNRVESSIISDAGGGGVVLVDGEDNAVVNNHIHHCGVIFFGGTGVVNPKGKRTRIAHNLIHDMPYCGIRGGDWGVELNEVIEYNHVHHVMQQLNDGACIFNCGIGSVIRGNRVHDSYGYSAQGWGLYLDEFRRGVLVEKNLSYNTRSGGLHLHNNYGHTIINNVFAFADTGQLSWTIFHGKHFGRQVEPYRPPLHTFQRNIIYWTQGTLSSNLGAGRTDLATKPEMIDRNLYFRAGSDPAIRLGSGGRDTFADWQKLGMDKNSLVADPLFTDPAAGDFSLRPGSPAFQLGIEPIDGSAAGLRRDERCGPDDGTLPEPTLRPAGAAFFTTQTVTLDSPSQGAQIHYTLDGSTPTAKSPRYTGPFRLAHSAVVKARSLDGEGRASAVVAAAFTKSDATLPAPLVAFDFEKGAANTGTLGGEGKLVEYAAGQGPHLAPGLQGTGLWLDRAARAGGPGDDRVGGALVLVASALNDLKRFTVTGWFRTSECGNMSRFLYKNGSWDLMASGGAFSLKVVSGKQDQYIPLDHQRSAWGDSWEFLALVVDGETQIARFYRGNSRAGSFSRVGEVRIPSPDASPSALEIGNLGGLRPFKGGMDQIRLFGAALDAAQVERLFTEQLPQAR